MLIRYKFLILPVWLFIIYFILPAKSFSQYSISGNVYYTDDNSPVTNSRVYILVFDPSTIEAKLIDSATINGDGNYTLYTFYKDSVLSCTGWTQIVPTDDHVTTYYPNTVDWEQAQPIYPPDNPSNINIGVKRIVPSDNGGSVSGMVITTDSNNNEVALVGATVVAQQNNVFKSYAITDAQGNYTLDSLNNGTCTVLATRIGYSMDSSNVNVNGNTNRSIHITLKKAKLIKHGSQNHTANRFYLSQNYPNPFNPTTKIRFSIRPPLTPLLSKEGTGLPAEASAQAGVVLTIYDILGRDVAKLVNEKLMPGIYEVTWDARNYASGIYFYTLRTNTFVQTRKMILIK